MRKSFIAALGLIIAIAVPAQAKEFESVKVCGKKTCAKTTDRDLMMGFLTDDGPSDDPPVGPFYTVKLSVREDKQTHSWWIDYAPEANMIRVESDYGPVWHALPPPSKRSLTFLGKVQPYPASLFPAMTKHTVGAFGASGGRLDKSTATADSNAASLNTTASETEPSTATQPRPASAPESESIPLVAVIMIFGLAAPIAAAIAIRRRRATVSS